MMIKEASKDDVQALLNVGSNMEEFRSDSDSSGFWSKEQLERWVESENDVCLVAVDNGKIIGFSLFAHHVPTGKVTYENAWVDKDYRGQGVASKLLSEGLEKLKDKGAKFMCSLTQEDAVSSIKFQEKNGFMKGFKFWWFHKELV